MPRKRQSRDIGKARALRANMSLPEVLLWQILRGRPEGAKIRRQHSLGCYVLDFYCARTKVGFEIDGTAHERSERPARDVIRDAWFRSQGVEIVRIPAADVLRSPEDVAEAIVRHCGG
jgi:very-short-patch-repair endonuclease